MYCNQKINNRSSQWKLFQQLFVNVFSEVLKFAHHRCTDRSHTFGYLCDKVLEMRSITNFILLTIRYPSLKEQLPNLQHLNIISSSVTPSLFFSFCACCPVRFDLVEKSVGWAWCLNDYRERKSSSCDHLRPIWYFCVRIYHSGCFRDVGKPKKYHDSWYCRYP